jgi:hypothetical protein
METLRRLAAYLVEHERVDGETFDELFDGRRPVPNAGDEWRAATARPRAWGDVVDLAARRASVTATPVPVPAVVAVNTLAPEAGGEAPSAEAALEPALAVADGAVSTVASASVDSIEADASMDGLIAAAGTLPVIDAAAPAGPRRPRARRRTARRARNVAAGWLRRAERWVRSGELEADRL